jgi:hypothetical protein
MTRHPGGGTRRSGFRSALVAIGGALLLCASAACSSDDDGGGAGSAPMPTPTLGERCTNAIECTSGLVCSAAGSFRGQCSAQCSGIDSCSMLAPAGKLAVCLTECGLRCTGNAECPPGTICGPVAGQMACVRAP